MGIMFTLLNLLHQRFNFFIYAASLKKITTFGKKAKIGCVSDVKMNLFILYFSQLALPLSEKTIETFYQWTKKADKYLVVFWSQYLHYTMWISAFFTTAILSTALQSFTRTFMTKRIAKPGHTAKASWHWYQPFPLSNQLKRLCFWLV